MEWEQRKLLLICPLCFNSFYHDTSSPSPTLGHVHIHQKHRKTVIGVQLGNIHQRQKQKKGPRQYILFFSSRMSGSAKKQKATKGKTSHPLSHRLALSIICLVLFLRLESSRPVICVSPGLSEDFSEPFTVLIFHFLDIALCLGWHILTLFFSYLLFMISRPLRCLVFPWCFVFSPLFFVPYCRNMWSWFSGLQACTNWRCANKQFLDTVVTIQ